MKKQLTQLAIAIIAASINAQIVGAQVAAGGNFRLEQSVVANGGGCSSQTGADCTGANAGAFSVEGTIGQAIAGVRSANQPFIARGGFWTAAFAVTSAQVSIGGRVLTSAGKGLRNARVTLIDQAGRQQTTLTSAFGNYSFEEVEAGSTVVISVASKRYQFQPLVVTVKAEQSALDFVPQQ